MGSPLAEPICLVENLNGSMHVCDHAIEYLCRIKQPVVVVSVVGLYRTGKSYLMNRLAGQKTGFALGRTNESKTKGIWMWCVPHPTKANHTLVLLDTEGLGDVYKGDSKNDAWIFCLAVLLSSTLVYNSRGTIDNTALENLHYITELTELIRVRSPPSEERDEDEEDSQFVKVFPNFIWAVRDFVLKLETEKRGQVTEDEYLDLALQLKKGYGKKESNYNLPRQCIRNYFPTRKCFVFPLPASQHKMTCLESLDEKEIFVGFLRVSERFCDYVFQTSKVKTLKGGQRVTGKMFGHLVRSYVNTISSGKVPCLENAVVTMAEIENQSAVQEGLKVYQSGMEQVKIQFPVSMSEITAKHQHFSNTATTEFMNRSFKDENAEYLKKLTEAVQKHYTELLVQNREASDKSCRELLSGLYKEMTERLQQGEYAKSGGYKLYCRDRDDIVTQYRSQPNKGVMAEDVLEEFLKNKSGEAKSILQADKKMSENEKEIQEERERAALLEQKNKVAEENQKELEQILQVERENHEDQVRQAKRKFEEELHQQQEEMDRALESKLAEQKDLKEKGLKEKAELLEKEIKELEKEKENIFKEYVMPIINVCKELLLAYFQYKSMIKQSNNKLK